MPNQAGSSPAKSRRSSSSRTGDTSCRGRTGEHWASPAEGVEEAKAEPGAEQPQLLPHLSCPAAPRVLLRPSWDFITCMRPEAGPAWAEGGHLDPSWQVGGWEGDFGVERHFPVSL